MKSGPVLDLGIVGCGSLLKQVYAKVLPRLPGAQVSYVTDLEQSAAAEAANLLGATAAGLDTLIDRSDVILIATPPHTHHSIALKALLPGKRVICEKPFVTKLAEAEELVSLAKARNAWLYVAHMRRFYPSVQLAREISKSGELGRLTKLFIHEGNRFKYLATSNYVVNDKSGGVVYDTGSHTLDMALYAGLLCDGELAIKMERIERDKAEPSHDIAATFTLVTDNLSIECEFHCSRVRHLSNKITFIFENGRMDLPTAVSNRVRVKGRQGNEIRAAADAISPLSAYYTQFNAVLADADDPTIAASRFVNLTRLVEAIATGKGHLSHE